MKPTGILSLDIGSNKICGVLFYFDNSGTPRIRGAMTRQLNKSPLEDGLLALPSMQIISLLQGIEKNFNLKIKKVIVNVGGTNFKVVSGTGVFKRKDENSPITKWELGSYLYETKDSLKIPREEVIHIIPQKFVLNNGLITKNPIGYNASVVETHISIVHTELGRVKKIRDFFENIGIEVEGIYCDILSAIEAILYPEDIEIGTLLIDIGGETMKGAIIKENTIENLVSTKSGANLITSDIKEILGIPWNYAEKIKKSVGSAYSSIINNYEVVSLMVPGALPREISRKKLSQLIESRMRELFDIFFTTLESQTPWQTKVKKITLTGGGALLSNISSLCEEISGLETTISFHTHNLPPIDDDELIKEIISPVYSVAIGQLWIYAKRLYEPDPLPSSWKDKILSFLNTIVLGN